MVTTAIEKLYETFERYPLKTIVGCPHCTTAWDSDHFQNTALRNLDISDLERLARKSMTTLGDIDDFRHFLPRMFELLAFHGGIGGTEAEVVVSKLDYAGWSDWPAEEREAVRAFLLDWWQHLLSNFPGMITANDALCSIAQAEDDLFIYLRAWEELIASQSAALRHFAQFIVGDIALTKRALKLKDAFWFERREQMNQVLRWVIRPQLVQLMEERFFISPSEDEEAISVAAHCLEGLIASGFPRF